MPAPTSRHDISFPRSPLTFSWRQPLRRSLGPMPDKHQSLTHGLLSRASGSRHRAEAPPRYARPVSEDDWPELTLAQILDEGIPAYPEAAASLTEPDQRVPFGRPATNKRQLGPSDSREAQSGDAFEPGFRSNLVRQARVRTVLGRVARPCYERAFAGLWRRWRPSIPLGRTAVSFPVGRHASPVEWG